MIQSKWWLGVALSAALCGCSDDSYKGTVPVDPDDADQSKVPVSLSLGKIVDMVTTTKAGAGAIGENDSYGTDIWTGREVYVFSFLNQGAKLTDRAEKVSDETLVPPPCLIDGGIVTNELADTDDYGMRTTVNTERLTMPEVYYPMDKEAAYGFFAYYCDAEKGDVSRTDEAISFPVEIDGTNDIMTAYAGRSNFSWEKYDQDRFAEDVRQKIEAWAYGVYTERRQVTPILNFKHHLVRFRFRLYGGAPVDSITVDTIEIVNCPKKTCLTVAVAPDSDGNVDEARLGLPKDMQEWTEPDDLALRQRNIVLDGEGKFKSSSMGSLKPLGISAGYGSATDPYGGDEENLLNKDENGKPDYWGESLLVPAMDSYQCRIKIRQHKLQENGKYDRLGQKFSTIMDIKLSNEAVFETGNVYTVRVAIFGAREIGIKTELVEWKNGGNVDVNGDKLEE